MNRTNKILLILVIMLFLVLVGLVVWQKFYTTPSYWAVYLRTGDLYFGKLMRFPSFGLKNVYTVSVNQQDAQNPISLQRFANVFWGPEDYLKINRDEVVWMTKLKSDGQLAELLKTNPNLLPSPSGASTQQQPPQNPLTPEGESNE